MNVTVLNGWNAFFRGTVARAWGRFYQEAAVSGEIVYLYGGYFSEKYYKRHITTHGHRALKR